MYGQHIGLTLAECCTTDSDIGAALNQCCEHVHGAHFDRWGSAGDCNAAPLSRGRAPHRG